MMKYLTRRPDLCLHQLSPGLCILFRHLLDHLTGLPVQGTCLSPERPPGQWQPSSFTAPSQRPVLPRFRPPPSKSQAEGPLLRAAEMFSNPTSGSESNKPAAPSGASVAYPLSSAPETPPNIRPAKALRSLLLQLRSFQLTMSRCFKQRNAAATNSCEIRFHSEPKAAMLRIFTRRA